MIPVGRFHITSLAAEHLRQIADDSRQRWGKLRAISYVSDLRSGFLHIADRHGSLPKRTRLTGSLKLSLYRVGSHYIAYTVLTESDVAITVVLHERMDVSTRLQDLHAHTAKQVGDIRARLLRSQFKPD